MKTSQDPGSTAFTLVELLVLIATIGVLVMVLIPALAGSKTKPQAVQCLENERQLAAGWLMYADDNRGKLAPNGNESDQAASSANDPIYQGAYLQWCPGRMDPTGPAGWPTNKDFLMAGCIYSYVRKVEAYHCPSDLSMVLVYGKREARVRSVSMNCWLNPINIWNATANGRTFRKLSDLGLMGPDKIYLIMDESPFGINDAYMAEYPPPAPSGDANLRWVEYPGLYHNGAATISFCDGHVILKKWSDQTVLGMNAQDPSSLPPSPTNSPDLPWLQSVATQHN